MSSKKDQILDIALSLFLEKGYDKTSISDILKHSDIARGTLYYHFESKEAIMDAIIERASRQIFADAEKICHDQTLSVYEKLFALFSSMNMRNLSEGSLMIDYLNHPQNALFHEKSNAMILEKITPLLGKIIAEGNLSGLFDNPFPQESAEMILLIGIGFLDTGRMLSSPEDFRHRTEAMFDVIERILGAEKGSLDPLKKFFQTSGRLR